MHRIPESNATFVVEPIAAESVFGETTMQAGCGAAGVLRKPPKTATTIIIRLAKPRRGKRGGETVQIKLRV
jgi:hypothetical protein